MASSMGLRISRLGALLAIGAPVLALVAVVGSGQGFWHFSVGLMALRWMLFPALAGLALAAVALLLGLIGKGRAGLGRAGVVLPIVALLVGGIYVWQVLVVRNQAETAPPIHDVATDLAVLPQFTALSVRPDNLDNVPDRDRADLAALDNRQRWERYHREAYADIAPLVLQAPPARVYDAAVALVGKRGWQVALADRAAGRIEATETVSLFNFKDDVVILLAPVPGGTRVDMRSVSRVGVSDLGYNARRIRSFLDDLKKAKV